MESFLIAGSSIPAVGQDCPKQRDALMGQMADSLPAMIWMCATDGRVTLFNTRWLEFTGLALETALAGEGAAAIHADDRARRIARQQAARDAYEPFETEYRLRRADGEFRWMLEQGAPQFCNGGDFRGYVGVAVDISERKRAEEKLRWLSKAVEQSPASIMITDLKGAIAYVNPKFTAVTGYTEEEALGQNPRILKSGEKPAGEYRRLWETIQTGEWRGEFHNKRKNGELYWESASICPIRDESGRPTHYIAVKEDITEQKLMGAALRASEERFRIAIEHARIYVYDVDPATGKAEIYSPTQARQGFETIDKWAKAIHPDDRERILAAHKRRCETGKGLREEYRIVTEDGTVRYYSDRGAPDCDHRVIGVMRDITEEKQAEESLAQLAAVVECSNDAILSLDAQAAIQRWNAAASRLYGYAAEEVLGRPASMLSTPELHLRATQTVADVLSGVSFSCYETRHIRKDGVVFPVSISNAPIRDREGKIVGGSVIIRDITERKRAEEALRESANLFRAIVQNSTDVITLVDPAGVILYDSPGISELLGISPEQRLGCEAFQWIHPDDLHHIGMLHEELLQAPGAKVRAQMRLRHADGSWRWFDSWAVNLLKEPGVGAVVTSFRDITELKGVESALRDSEQRYRKLIEDASDIIYTTDLKGNITSVNSMGERLTGYCRQELVGMNVAQLLAEECGQAMLSGLEARIARLDPGPFETDLVARDGHRVALEVSGRLQFRNGSPAGVLCIARDVSQRKRTERLEHDRRKVLETVVQNQPLEAVLRRLEEMIEHYYPGASTRILLAGEDADAVSAPSHLKVPIRARDGLLLGNIEIDHPESWEVTDSERVFLDSKAKLAAIALEHQQLTNRLAYQAHHDSLTGLPNRSLLEDRLRQAITLARRQATMVAVIYVDLDHFKFINDTLGHDVGDMLLKQVGERLAGAVRQSDTLARTGGDEFVAVLLGVQTDHEADRAGERMMETMQHPFQVMGHELFVKASVGLSLYPQDGDDAATLQKHADVAMYEAKNRGRNRFQRFAREMDSACLERLEIESHLHRSLERGELQLYYQPQFEAPSEKFSGVEALLRWNHPKWGLVPPNRFIPVAEESGLIIPISFWVLQEACRQHQLWRRAGYPPVTMAVNISATQFTRSKLSDKVAEALAANGMRPGHLEVELTERVLMQDVEDTSRQIAELRQLGVRISIDDFGTGYSSLSYLQHLPIDDLKIDKCFVQGLDQVAGRQSLVQAIVGLAHGMNMTATAEGVETESELAALRALGCDRVQGFLLGRPVPAAQLETQWRDRAKRY